MKTGPLLDPVTGLLLFGPMFFPVSVGVWLSGLRQVGRLKARKHTDVGSDGCPKMFVWTQVLLVPQVRILPPQQKPERRETKKPWGASPTEKGCREVVFTV